MHVMQFIAHDCMNNTTVNCSRYPLFTRPLAVTRLFYNQLNVLHMFSDIISELHVKCHIISAVRSGS